MKKVVQVTEENKIDWENLFKPEDFDGTLRLADDLILKITGKNNNYLSSMGDTFYGHVAELANARLREILKDAPVVYGVKSSTVWSDIKDNDEALDGPDTYSAKLIDVREL